MKIVIFYKHNMAEIPESTARKIEKLTQEARKIFDDELKSLYLNWSQQGLDEDAIIDMMNSMYERKQLPGQAILDQTYQQIMNMQIQVDKLKENTERLSELLTSIGSPEKKEETQDNEQEDEP